VTPHPTPHPTRTPIGGAVQHAVGQAAGALAQPPSLALVLSAAIIAAVVAVALWGLTGHFVTMAHEGAHALFAVLLGGRIVRVRLNRDQTGETVQRGGAFLLLFTFAGYVGPAMFGFLGAVALAHGRADAVLWISVALLGLLFLAPMNAFARLVVFVAGAGLLWTAARATVDVQQLVATAWIWLLLAGGVVQILEDGTGAEDFRAMRRRTFIVPATAWAGIALVLSVAALAGGAALMLGVVDPPL
jgi:Peptidase M50B-like